MKKMMLVVMAALVVACSQDENHASVASDSAAQLQCNSPILSQQVSSSIQQTISKQAQQFAQVDTRHWVDADKIIAAATQLSIHIDESRFKDNTCQTMVHINLPDNVIKQSQQNAPLLQVTPILELISSRIMGSNSQFNGSTLSFPLNYQVSGDKIIPSDNNLNGISNLLADALLPYGVKETLMVDGKAITREKALALLNQPEPEVPSAPMEIKDVPPMKEEAVPSEPADLPKTEAKVSTKEASTPEIIMPVEATKRISTSELDNAKQLNQEADVALKGAWRNIDPEIQKDLVDEQKSWERKKQTACVNAASKGADESESQYLRIQCDTRMTREQIQYLKGYSIND